MAWRPFESAVSSELSKWGKNMSLPQPKGLVMIDSAYEGSNIYIILGSIHVKDCFDALFPRFHSLRSHPKSKEVSFFYKPLALQRFAFHIV